MENTPKAEAEPTLFIVINSKIDRKNSPATLQFL